MQPTATLVQPAVTKRVVPILMTGALLIITISLFGTYVQLFIDSTNVHRYIHHIIDKTNIDTELSVPAFYAVLLLLISSSLCWFIAHNQPVSHPHRRHWFGLALIFLLLALDECVGFHEYLNVSTLKVYAPSSKFLRWTWVIPGALFSLSVGLMYIQFLRSLPRNTGGLIFIAGATYIAGALGVEMLGAAFYTTHGQLSLSYKLTTHVEELLEMTGLILFIYSLLNYIKLRWRITIDQIA